jgi:hypothetical protein
MRGLVPQGGAGHASTNNKAARYSRRVAQEMRQPVFEHKKEKEMNKLLSVIVAAMFAVGSVSAFAASHAGAQMKDEKKTEKKAKAKPESEKTQAEKDAAKKKKAAAKKDAPKKDAKAAPKKDEMKK